MVDRSWVLAALVDGPRLATLRAAGRHELDHDVLRRSLERPRRGSVSSVVTLRAESTAEVAADPNRWAAVVDRPGRRWRWEHGGALQVDDGSTMTFLAHAHGTTQPSTGEVASHVLGALLEPAVTASGFEIGDPVDAEALGRPCASVIGTARPHAEGPGLGIHGYGDRLRIVLDLATGLILRWQSWFDGDELAELSIEELDIDGPVTDADFAVDVPPGADVRTAEERVAEMRSRIGWTAPDDWAAQAGDDVAMGPPPADVAAAEAAVRHAVEHLDVLSDDGADAVNVQGGAGLGPAFADAGRRFGAVTFAARYVRFLRPDEAVVFFDVQGTPMGVMAEKGRAVLVDGRWLVERRTATRLLRRAHARIPPAPGPPTD